MATTINVPSSPDYGPEVQDGDVVIEPTPNARAGVTEHNVRYVLALGLSGAIAAFVLVFLIFWH